MVAWAFGGQFYVLTKISLEFSKLKNISDTAAVVTQLKEVGPEVKHR